MKYTKLKDNKLIDRALGLSPERSGSLKKLIGEAYQKAGESDQRATIDDINAYVAPKIKTPEEAFFCATVILTDVFATMQFMKQRENQIVNKVAQS